MCDTSTPDSLVLLVSISNPARADTQNLYTTEQDPESLRCMGMSRHLKAVLLQLLTYLCAIVITVLCLNSVRMVSKMADDV